MIRYLEHLSDHDSDLYAWACAGKSPQAAAEDLSRLARMLVVFELDEITDPYLDGSENASVATPPSTTYS